MLLDPVVTIGFGPNASIPFVVTFGFGIGNQSIPVANFVGSPVLGAVPFTVQFTDTSTGAPTSWLWDFGDGKTSTLQNPQHVYEQPGTYTVTLTATNAAGSNSKKRVNYITATKKPTPVPQKRPEGTGTRDRRKQAVIESIWRRRDIDVMVAVIALDDDEW